MASRASDMSDAAEESETPAAAAAELECSGGSTPCGWTRKRKFLQFCLALIQQALRLCTIDGKRSTASNAAQRCDFIVNQLVTRLTCSYICY